MLKVSDEQKILAPAVGHPGESLTEGEKQENRPVGPVFVVEIIGDVALSENHRLHEESDISRAPFQGEPLLKEMDMKTGVFVSAYERVRFGRVEHVCAHWRSR